MTKGVPACGKSTWACEELERDVLNTVIINRDSMRKGFFNAYWQFDRTKRDLTENFITKAAEMLIRLGLDEGKTVIVDETNLSKYSNKLMDKILADYPHVVFEVKDFTDVPLNTCIERDMKRDRSVGESVIREKYNKYIKSKDEIRNSDGYINIDIPIFNPCATTPLILNDLDLPYAIIVDMDGTLADGSHRSPYDDVNCDKDAVFMHIRDLVKRMVDSGDKCIIVSGRDGGRAGEKSIQWLNDNNIPYDEAYFRSAGDRRKDFIVKEEIFDNNIRNRYNVRFVLDDRNQTVDKWREIGLPCLQVAPGNF